MYDALQNQQENMEELAVIILSEIDNQSHLPSLLLNLAPFIDSNDCMMA